MICDIKNSLEANHGPIFSIHKFDVETWSFQCSTLRMHFSESRDILCPAVLNLKYSEYILELQSNRFHHNSFNAVIIL